MKIYVDVKWASSASMKTLLNKIKNNTLNPEIGRRLNTFGYCALKRYTMSRLFWYIWLIKYIQIIRDEKKTNKCRATQLHFAFVFFETKVPNLDGIHYQCWSLNFSVLNWEQNKTVFCINTYISVTIKKWIYLLICVRSGK